MLGVINCPPLGKVIKVGFIDFISLKSPLFENRCVLSVTSLSSKEVAATSGGSVFQTPFRCVGTNPCMPNTKTCEV